MKSRLFKVVWIASIIMISITSSAIAYVQDSELENFRYYELSADPLFYDIEPGKELAVAVEYVYQHGIFVGDKGKFKPLEPISRDEMVLIAYRLNWKVQPEWKGDTIHITRREFADRYKGWNSGWFRSPWKYPYEKLRRGQLALMLYRNQGNLISWNPIKLTGFGGMKPVAEVAWRLAKYSFPKLRFMGGFARSGHVSNSDHYWGGAFDAGGPTQTMQKFRNWLLHNIDVLNVKYLIFDRVFYSPYSAHRYTGKSPHIEHVHTSFDGR